MKNSRVKEDIIMVIIISLIGFCIENLWMLSRNSLIDNRNMYLPFLLGYGLFVILIYYLIGIPNKIFNKYDFSVPTSFFIYMVICFILVSVGEIMLGTFIEKTGDFYYWDYTSIPLHFTRYSSVPTSIGFALGITLFMGYVYVPLKNKIIKLSKYIPTFLVVIAFIILLIDFNVSFKNMYTNNGNNIIWTIVFKK
ncbi:MAG: putative ABC transporter permease [Bacilli bacterium]|nr:putative ABC transporter permease [Bacilli bacterium]